MDLKFKPKMCEARLEEIRELVGQIPSYNRVVNIDNGAIELYVESGYAVAHLLFEDYEGKVSVVRTSMAKDTLFEYHTHKEIETISVYEGTLILTVNDPKKKDEEEIMLNVGDVYVVPVGIPHKAFCPIKTKMIVQVVPSPKPFSQDGNG